MVSRCDVYCGRGGCGVSDELDEVKRMELNKIYHGNNLDILKTFPDNSIDSIVTDPPYGINFMNKKWDYDVPKVELWQEVLRVLKPGGHALVACGTRTQHRMAVNLEDAGFEIRDIVAWVYGQGFPKSTDVIKELEKLLNKYLREVKYEENISREQKTEYNMRPLWKAYIQESKYISKEQWEVLQSSMSEQSSHRTMLWKESEEGIENGKESCMEGWSNIQESKGELQGSDICESTEKTFSNGKERWLYNGTPFSDGKLSEEIIEENGSSTSHRPQSKQQQYREPYVIFLKRVAQEIRGYIEEYVGWGTALKPAMELWTLCRKPLDGTVANNVLKHGVGGINIDGCRVPFGNETDNRVGTETKRGDSKKYKYSKDDLEIIKELDDDLDFVWTEKTEQFKNLDEFYDFLDDYHFYKPRENTILDFDIFDYEVVILHSEKKKVVPLIETFKNKLNSNSMFGQSDKGVQMYKGNGRFPANFIHDGSDEVLKLFPNTEQGGSITKTYEDNSPLYGDYKQKLPFESYGDSGSAARFFYTAKASQIERNWGLHGFEEDVVTDGRTKPIDNAFNRGETKRKNIHPTVKPIDLMRYLVRLVTPKGGVCLDPYMGSGTTAVACKAEKINYIGCELEEEYIKIAEARIKAENVVYDIFDFGA